MVKKNCQKYFLSKYLLSQQKILSRKILGEKNSCQKMSEKKDSKKIYVGLTLGGDDAPPPVETRVKTSRII